MYMKNKQLILMMAAICSSIAAQQVTRQFHQTCYDIKDICMTDPETGWAVGAAHWDPEDKNIRTTILKTVSRGEEWFVQDADFYGDLWDVHFTDAVTGWAVGDSGTILHTSDGGTCWNRQNSTTDLNFKSVAFSDAQNGWAAANEMVHSNPFGDPDAWHGRIFHTSNGGQTWSEQPLPPDAGLIHCIYFINVQRGWALGVQNVNIDVFADTKGIMYYTDDGGNTWTEKYAPDIDFVFTDMDFVDENRGWAVGFAGNSGETGGSVFRTIDGGASWQRIQETETFWEVDFVDSLNGYAAGADYISAWGPPVLRSRDGGRSWVKIRMEEHQSQGIYGLAVFENEVIGLGDEGYMILSTDPWGETGMWYGEDLFTQSLINDLYEFEDVFFINEEKGWVVGRKSAGAEDWAQVILHTDNGGEAWTEQYVHTAEWMSNTLRLNAIQFVSETTGWAVGHSSLVGENQTTGVLFTNDGGLHWQQQAVEVADGQMVDLFFFDDRTGWVLTDANAFPGMSAQLLKTADGGDTWSLVNTEQEGIITIGYAIRTGTVLFQDENTGWILGAQCDLLWTADGGATWQKASLPLEYHNTHSMDFCDDENGIICGETVMRTANGGMLWTEEYLTDRTLTDVMFTSACNGWMVGEWGEIYKTGDKGVSWEPVIHSAGTEAIRAVHFPDPDNGWTAGRGGTILRIDNSGTPFRKVPDSHPAGYFLTQNYPNPFNAYTLICFSIPVPEEVALTIYNIRGEKVVSLEHDFKPAGSYNIEWDGRDQSGGSLTSGIYICELQTGGCRLSRKMFLIK